jgi:hypothetical protein
MGVIEDGVCTITPGGPSRSRAIGRGAVQVLAHATAKKLNGTDSDPDEFYSGHPGGLLFLMGDAGVRFVRTSIHPAVYQAQATRNGGEVISQPGH